jgi:hypothetical protein
MELGSYTTEELIRLKIGAKQKLEAIEEEINSRKIDDTKLKSIIDSLTSLFSEHKEDYLLFEQPRNNTGPEVTIFRLKDVAVYQKHSQLNIVSIYPSFYAYYDLNGNCNCHFASKDSSNVIYVEPEEFDMDEFVEKIKHSIKNKDAIKIFIANACVKHVFSFRKEMLKDSNEYLGLDFKTINEL